MTDFSQEEQMKCIFCKEERSEDKFRPEHVFPGAIGGSFCINTVCTDCNSRLGTEVDSKLTDHFFIRSIRYQLGLTGKKGKMPLPFRRGKLVGGPSDDEGAINVVFRDGGSNRESEIKILPKKYESYTTEDGVEWHRFADDPQEKGRLISMVHSFLRREGLPEISEDEILSHCKLVMADPNLVECEVEIDTVKYKRAVVKIAYELACEWLGPGYLDDLTGEKLRRFVREPLFIAPPEENAINGTVGFTRTPYITGLAGDLDYSHRARVSYSESSLVAEVIIFNVIRGCVTVTENLHAYPLFIPRRLEIDPVRRRHVVDLLQGVLSRL
jgi:hypothetical protein